MSAMIILPNSLFQSHFKKLLWVWKIQLHYRINNTADWVSIFPNKHGFVRSCLDGHYFSVSIYHQLHCLNGLRCTFLVSAPGKHQVMGEKVEDLHTMWLHGHTEHCLSFIRPVLLCKAIQRLKQPNMLAIPRDSWIGGQTVLGWSTVAMIGRKSGMV